MLSVVGSDETTSVVPVVSLEGLKSVIAAIAVPARTTTSTTARGTRQRVKELRDNPELFMIPPQG
jgi:hypothetical protein